MLLPSFQGSLDAVVAANYHALNYIQLQSYFILIAHGSACVLAFDIFQALSLIQMSWPRMATLSSIPFDVRAIILDYVLFTPRLILPGLNLRQAAHDYPSTSWGDGDDVLYLTDPGSSRPNSLDLLLTNHQLHEETKDRLTLHKTSYSLRIALLREKQLSPTWTCIPSLAHHIDIVNASFHIVGSTSTFRWPTVFDQGCGSPPPIVWPFYELLERFFCRGASTPKPIMPGEAITRARRGRYTIGHLRIIVQSTKLEPHQRIHPNGIPKACYATGFLSDEEKRNFVGEDGVEYLMDPEWLAQFLVHEMDMLLSMTCHATKYGCMLFESMEKISISCDGKTSGSWDLAEIMASWPPEGPREAFQNGREGDYRQWIVKAVKRRTRRGLEVAESMRVLSADT